MNNLNELEKILGYEFKDKSLLKTALTHSSYANEHNLENNERMEFLGDAVLELSMSKYLYNTISFDEGVLTKRRAQLVCENALNIYASKIDFNRFIYLGVGEEATGGRNRPAIIADAVEAVLGAIFLDGGFIPASDVVFRLFIPYINEAILNKDYKSILQEKLQSEKRSIHYEIVKETGIPNNKTFEAVVYMDNILMGKGKGKSKKEAEMAAAKDALEKEAR